MTSAPFRGTSTPFCASARASTSIRPADFPGPWPTSSPAPPDCPWCDTITTTGTATPGWGYAPAERVVNHFLGNAQRLWDGRSLVAVPDVGSLDIVDDDGNLERRVIAERKFPLRFAEAIPSLYP